MFFAAALQFLLFEQDERKSQFGFYALCRAYARAGRKFYFHENCVYYTIPLRQNQHFFATFSFKIANSFVCTNSVLLFSRFLVNSPKQPVVPLFLLHFSDFYRFLPLDFQNCCARNNWRFFFFNWCRRICPCPAQPSVAFVFLPQTFLHDRVASSFIFQLLRILGKYPASARPPPYFVPGQPIRPIYSARRPDELAPGRENVTGFPSKRPPGRQNRHSASGLCPRRRG